MVKPPKSWLEEYSKGKSKYNNNDSNQQAKNKSSSSFGSNTDNSFRHYMARKIDLQRGQFGLVLPPTPPDDNDNNNNNNNNNSTNLLVEEKNHCNDLNSKDLSQNKTTFINNDNNGRGKKSVRFVNENNEKIGIESPNHIKTEMNAIMTRLKEKHGTRRRRKIRRLNTSSKYDLDLIEQRTMDNGSSKEKIGSKSQESLNLNDTDTDTQSNNLVESSQSQSQPTITMLDLKRKRPDLFFLGVTVMVNGYTNPDSDTIMRTLHRFGGNLEKYETSQVTHIIAENLSTAKANIYKRQKKPIPVVKPKWIVDCVESRKLLPYQDYLIDEVKDEHLGTSTSVKLFFKSAQKEVTTNHLSSNENNSPSNSSSGQISSTTSVMKKGTSSPSVQKPILGPRTVGNDPNFLTNYFANSRLSFIGSFKQRVRQSSHKHETSKSRHNSKRFVFHVDMDCFFAAIAVRNYPQYKDKPVAVGHGWKNDPNFHASSPNKVSGSSRISTSELSTCNYAARKFGVKKGMFAHRARQLCPDLVILPYDYEGYEEASSKVSDILGQFADVYDGIIEQVSCDESYLEIGLDENIENDVEIIGDSIRQEILNATDCTASIGISNNKLLAKLATDKVKDNGGNGIHLISNVKEFLADIKLRDLPGVGYQLDKKLQSNNLFYVSDIWTMENDEELCSILGKGNGSKIFNYCQGIDTRQVKAVERKTIGAECNYGVRFDGPYGVDYMMKGLATEVVKRMTTVGLLGKHITIKVKERQANAPAPGKFNGHGKCNDHSKSCYLSVRSAVRDIDLFSQEGMKLFKEIGVDKDEVRGMGMIISKLEHENENLMQSLDKENMNFWLRQESKDVFKTNVSEVDEMIKLTNPTEVMDNQNTEIPVSPSGRVESETETVILNNNSNSSYAEAIELPPVEDISISDVMALPCDLRESILVKIQEQTSEKVKRSHLDTPKPKRKKLSKSNSVRSKFIPKADGRHIDMKRMMKLVSVKSGLEQIHYDGGNVSLTQLDHLPLDIQLQVANSDNITMKIPPMSLQKPSASRPRKILFDSPIEIEDEDVMEICSSENDRIMVSDVFDIVEENKDIKVLTEWLDERNDPSNEDIERLNEFFFICIKEMRVDDVVIFLRLLKRKSRSWTNNQYKDILKTCNDNMIECQGRKLDLQGLGLHTL